jgi:hypothetical protein
MLTADANVAHTRILNFAVHNKALFFTIVLLYHLVGPIFIKHVSELRTGRGKERENNDSIKK